MIESLRKVQQEKSTFKHVYGLDVTLSINLKPPVYQLIQDLRSKQDEVQNKINQLIDVTSHCCSMILVVCMQLFMNIIPFH